MQDKPQNELIKTGDVFVLGDHRLICGDAKDNNMIERLIGSKKIRCILTDPPYGVAYVENKSHFKSTIGANLSNTTIIEGDQLQSDGQYANFTKKWLEVIVPKLDSYNTFYIFNSDLMLCALRGGAQQAGYYYSQMIIWIKNNIVVGRKDFLPQHELIIYGWHGRHKTERSKLHSVIFYPKPRRSILHPTMKPVGLLRKLILNSTKIGDIVYDPFGGSGSTLIACEHTKRACFMAEIDPNYCQTVINRWMALTGKQAQRAV